MRSGAVAALSVAGVLEIHRALLYSHPEKRLLGIGPNLVSLLDTAGPQELSMTGLQLALTILRPEVFLP